MIDEIAIDYSKYLKIDISKELQPIHVTIEELLTRLEEFENLMKVIESENREYSSNAFSIMLQCQGEVDILLQRIDALQLFVSRVTADLNMIEKQVEIAESEIGVPDNKLKSLFKPFFNKITKDSTPNAHETRSNNLEYVKPVTFKTSDYFSDHENEL